MQPDINSGGVVPPRPSVFEPIVRLWFGLLNAIVWCLTFSTGRVVYLTLRARPAVLAPLYQYW